MTKHIKNNKYIKNTPIIQLGSLLHIDFGFVRGKVTQYTTLSSNKNTTSLLDIKNDDLPLKSCRNGFNFYLLITDSATRYNWVFPLSSKKPPIDLVNSFLTKYGIPNFSIRTDLEGELTRSIDFRKLLCKYNYTFQLTAP